jgi:DNA repair exonuclease SbcCD nuclease subunit
MPRLLHTADWQIGRQFTTFPPESAVPLMEARFAAVERLARLATEHRVDAVLVAGDVFDAQTVTERTLRRVFNLLAGYTGSWVLLPGNHDAALSESVWRRAERLGIVPPGVHLALRPEPIVLAEAGVVVLPAPLTQRHTYNDLTEWFEHAETPPGLARIGLAHGSVQGLLAEDIDSPNPIAPDRAERARLDYLALGDWHGCRDINARTWYSGTPEPDRHKDRDNGAGQALLVELEGAAGAVPQVTRLPVGQYRWRRIDLAMQVETDLDTGLDTLATLDAADVVDLRLSGQLDLAAEQRLLGALAQAEARVRHLDVDRSALRLAPTADDIAALRADGYLDALIRELHEVQQGASTPSTSSTPATETGLTPELAREALALLAAALAERRAGTGL